MVLGSFGVDISESALRTRCDCTPYGTDALMAVDAARALGFVKTAKYTLSLAELKTVVAGGHYPIVFVDLNPIDGLRCHPCHGGGRRERAGGRGAGSSPGGTPVSYLRLHGGLGKATQPRDACGALAPQRGEKPVENDNARPDPFSRSLEDVVFLWRCRGATSWSTSLASGR